MKAFFNLSQRGQIIRLRKLANAALQRYDIGEISLRFLSNTDNAVFRVCQITEKSRQIENLNVPETIHLTNYAFRKVSSRGDKG